MENFLKHSYQSFLRLLAPPFCAYCRFFLNQDSIFCDVCMARLVPLVSTSLEINSTYSMKIFAVSKYQEPIKTLILAKSWSARSACKQMAELMWTRTTLPFLPFDYLIPIPLHWTRFSYRGYNQAEIIAQELSRKSGKPFYNFLKRIRRTPFQSSLPLDDRKNNVRTVFELTERAAAIQNKHIVIVDDLMTTGATLQAAAKILASMKPASINAVVTARAC